MTEPRVLSAPERSLIRRLKRLAQDRISRSAALSNRLDDLARERAGLARDLPAALGERADLQNRAFAYSAERRAVALERAEARIRDLETRIAALDAEVQRLRASQAGLQADARAAAEVFAAFKKQVNRAVDPFFHDEVAA